jgi:hypothetical protein
VQETKAAAASKARPGETVRQTSSLSWACAGEDELHRAMLQALCCMMTQRPHNTAQQLLQGKLYTLCRPCATETGGRGNLRYRVIYSNHWSQRIRSSSAGSATSSSGSSSGGC